MRSFHGPLPPLAAAAAICALASASRALDLADGLHYAATPASAVALASCVVLRWRGVAATLAGFLAAGLLAGLGIVPALIDGGVHAGAALAASLLMRALARRFRERTRTQDWLVSLAGVSTFAAVAALILALGPALLAPVRDAFPSNPLHALVFQPLGLLTFGAVLASIREAPLVRARPAPALATLALGLGLIVTLWLLLRAPLQGMSPGGLTLLLSLPFCLWVAMQSRSFDGALLSFIAAHVVLVMVLGAAGSLGDPEFIVTIAYLNLLIAVCQLVHAVNRDRLDALAEVEEQKRVLEARVAERTADLAAAMEAAQAADAAKSRFVAMVSHEVRTPLSGVLGMTSLVLSGALEPQVRARIEVIRASGLHLLDVIDRILDFSRLDRPLRPGEGPPFDLGRLVREVVDEARVLPYAEGIDLDTEIEPGLPLLRQGDRRSLRQILTNLVGNALKFTEAGSVTIRLRSAPGESVRLEVADTGIGIPPTMRKRIFLPFERAEGVERIGGTGLGLAICAELVARMSGTIGVASEPGRGSVFHVVLPLPPVAAPAPRPRMDRASA